MLSQRVGGNPAMKIITLDRCNTAESVITPDRRITAFSVITLCMRQSCGVLSHHRGHNTVMSFITPGRRQYYDKCYQAGKAVILW